MIYWNAESAKLRNEGIPDKFELKAVSALLRILSLRMSQQKTQDLLEALQSVSF